MTTTHATTPAAPASKLTAEDRKLFRGTAAEVHDWMDNDAILRSIGCNFEVERHPAQVGDRTYPDCQLWLRSDNHNYLGAFGNRRQVIQPASFIDYFRSFCAASEKRISLDLVGTLDGGRTFYMASKLSGNNHALLDSTIGGGYGVGGGMAISRQGSSAYMDRLDRTDSWLVVTDYYGESLSPRAVIFNNELICSNGLSIKVTDQQVKLTHRIVQSYDEIAQVLGRALQQCAAYSRMKDRMLEIPVTEIQARNAIRAFFRDPDGESQTVKRLERIYNHDLIGGDLDTRQGNLWRLASAVTQYTSHERIGSSANAGGRTLRSQLEGARARTNQRFLAFLEEQFAPNAELALV